MRRGDGAIDSGCALTGKRLDSHERVLAKHELSHQNRGGRRQLQTSSKMTCGDHEIVVPWHTTEERQSVEGTGPQT